MRNCFRQIPETLEAVYFVFRMFLVNICFNVKKLPLNPQRTERQSVIKFNFPSFSGYIVCAEAILYFCVSDATGKRNNLRLLLRQRRGARKRRMQSVDRRDRLPDYRTFRASPFWKNAAHTVCQPDKNRTYILPLIRFCGVSASEKSANTSKGKLQLPSSSSIPSYAHPLFFCTSLIFPRHKIFRPHRSKLMWA